MPVKWFLVVCIVVFLLLLRLLFFFDTKTVYRDGETITLTTTLKKDPVVEGRFQRLTISSQGGGPIFITTSRFPAFFYGQTIKIIGKVRVKVLENKQPIYTMYFPIIEARKNSTLSVLSPLRRNLIIIFSSSLPTASSSLLLGIAFGIRETMSNELAEQLRLSGVMHITAASGMNVTMTAGALFTFLSRFLRRQYALGIGLVCIWFYALLTGLDAAILRASLMASLAFSAGLFGRQHISLFALLLTGAIMLFVSPGLISDVGFQLSFLATAGIILFSPIFGLSSWHGESVPMHPKKKEGFHSLFQQDIGTTIAAQIATLPLMFIYFGQYNIMSIVVNVLILWTIPILMTLGILGAIVGLVIFPVGQIIIFLTMPVLSYLQWVVGLFGKAEYTINLSFLSWGIVVGYYLLLGAGILYIQKQIKAQRSNIKT